MGFKLEAATSRDRGFEPKHWRTFAFFLRLFLSEFQHLLVFPKTTTKSETKQEGEGENPKTGTVDRYQEIHEDEDFGTVILNFTSKFKLSSKLEQC